MELLTTNELCEFLKVSRMTIWKLDKEGLPSIVVGGNKRYDKEKVIKWLEERG